MSREQLQPPREAADSVLAAREELSQALKTIDLLRGTLISMQAVARNPSASGYNFEIALDCIDTLATVALAWPGQS